MNGSAAAKDRLAAEYRLIEDRLPGRTAGWLRALRGAAFTRFDEGGFPTPRQEDWKYTSLAPIERQPFSLTVPTPAAPPALPALSGHTAVFVNGAFSAAQSRLGDLPAGVAVTSLAAALERDPQALEPHLGRLAGPGANGFVALNTAMIADGACVRVAPGVRLERPVVLVYTVTAGDPVVTSPRNLVIAAEDSALTLVEVYLGDGVYLTNAVTEVHVGPRAAVEHCKLQRESDAAFHIAAVHVRQAQDSRFMSRSFAVGARLARNDISAVFGAPGGECTLEGLYLASGRQHIDNQTFIDHAAPHCTSRELYKGVLDGRSRSVFNGRIRVQPGAQQTDAQQSNHNLLLSADAEADTKPQLEIYADDVRCGHGATVGFLDADALFYLRSRGLSEGEARGLLTYAFVRELIDRLPQEGLRHGVEREVLDRLPGLAVPRHDLAEMRP